MIIVSQSKKVYNFDNVISYEAIEIEDGRGLISLKMINNDFYYIATYDSYERAEEIVEEINNTYCPVDEYKKGITIQQGNFLNSMPKKYVMPEE